MSTASPLQASTREKVLVLALTRWNERGLESFGIRELARELELSPGNVSYHFRQKEDLVLALMEQLHDLNNATLGSVAAVATVGEFLAHYRGVFRNQHAYRFLPLSAGTILTHYERAAALYRKVEGRRRRELTATLERLRIRKQLSRKLDDGGIARILGLCSLTARSWLAEYELWQPKPKLDRAIDHYLALIAHGLLPHAAPRARAELEPYLNAVR